MKITKRQLRRIIKEESKGSTKKYDDDSALRGGQSELPDSLQKGIIDKTDEDREEEEKNESTRITKRQLRRIIKEEIARLNEEDYDAHRDSRREQGLGGQTWERKQAYKSTRARQTKYAEKVTVQGREDALAGRPLDPSIAHLAYIKAYDDTLAGL